MHISKLIKLTLYYHHKDAICVSKMIEWSVLLIISMTMEIFNCVAMDVDHD